MEWGDDAFVLSARAHGETGAIVELLTARHGRHAGHLPGGASRRMKPFLQPGARVTAEFRSRTSDQLGSLRLEPVGEGPAALFDDDGWYRTEDVGVLDATGFLTITDRKKELLKTSGGKLIAPQPIENKLKAHALVGNAALVGDKHKFASAILSPDHVVELARLREFLGK